jgi:hypothetical protein
MTDRFFLNAVEGDDDAIDSRYVLNRSEYVRNLCKEDIKCVVLSTYGFNVESSRLEISGLLGPDSKIPTLIVHGDRKRALLTASLLRKANLEKANSRESHGMDAQDTCGENHSQDANSISMKQEAHLSPTKCYRDHSQNRTENVGTLSLPESVRIERILPQWLYPVDHASSLDSGSKPTCSYRTSSSLWNTTAPKNSACSSSSGSSGSNNNNNSDSSSNDRNPSHSVPIVPQCVQNASYSDRLGGHVMGVHHPKYILTFTSLGIHVLIR